MPDIYTDPVLGARHFNQAIDQTGQQLAGLNLYDPALLSQLSSILQPYFKSQQANFMGQYGQASGQAMNQAGANAGAIAAYKGYSPSDYVSNARQRASNSLTPQYFQGMNQMGTDQLQALLSALMGSQQFKAQNLGTQLGSQQNLLNSYEGARQFNTQTANQPGFWDYLGAGALGLAGSFLGPVGAAAGTALGGSLFGKKP